MAPRLKVFTWSNGFHAYTVAASSRPKALEAWRSGQDLFANGVAHELEAGPDFEAAMASPGEVIERGEAVDVGKLAKIPKQRATSKKPSEAQRKKVAALEADLERLDRETADSLAEIDRRLAELADERRAREAEAGRDRDKLVKALKAARTNAGG